MKTVISRLERSLRWVGGRASQSQSAFKHLFEHLETTGFVLKRCIGAEFKIHLQQIRAGFLAFSINS